MGEPQERVQEWRIYRCSECGRVSKYDFGDHATGRFQKCPGLPLSITVVPADRLSKVEAERDTLDRLCREHERERLNDKFRAEQAEKRAGEAEQLLREMRLWAGGGPETDQEIAEAYALIDRLDTFLTNQEGE